MVLFNNSPVIENRGNRDNKDEFSSYLPSPLKSLLKGTGIMLTPHHHLTGRYANDETDPQQKADILL